MRNNTPSAIYEAKTLFNTIGEAMHNGPKNRNADNYASMKSKVEQQLQNYDDAVSQNPNSLHTLTPLWPSECAESKTARNMYMPDGEQIQQIRNDLMQLNGGGDRYKCPICECNDVYHLDHYIPREKMPEFSVHPKNLIYICERCNKEKHTMWLNNNSERIIFNAYYDTPSGKDLLKCEVNKIENDMPKADILWNTGVQHTAASLREKTTIEKLKICNLYLGRINELLQTLCELALEQTKRMKGDGMTIGDIWNIFLCDFNNVLSHSNDKVIQRLTYQGIINSTVMRTWLDTHS